MCLCVSIKDRGQILGQKLKIILSWYTLFVFFSNSSSSFFSYCQTLTHTHIVYSVFAAGTKVTFSVLVDSSWPVSGAAFICKVAVMCASVFAWGREVVRQYLSFFACVPDKLMPDVSLHMCG